MLLTRLKARGKQKNHYKILIAASEVKINSSIQYLLLFL